MKIFYQFGPAGIEPALLDWKTKVLTIRRWPGKLYLNRINYDWRVSGIWIKLSLFESKKISLVPIEGDDFLNGVLKSPYCNIKFLKSFLFKKTIPCNSATSRSNQFAFWKTSAIEFNWKLYKWLYWLIQKINNLSCDVRLWKL